jgi:hypothetical protein
MFRHYLPDPRFVLLPSNLGSDVATELARLNPPAPGCDVVALAVHLDPAKPEGTEAILGRTPFGAPPYRIYHWPGAFVVRYAPAESAIAPARSPIADPAP